MNKNKKKKNSGAIQTTIVTIASILTGAVCGFLSIEFAHKLNPDEIPLLALSIMLLMVFLFSILQTIIHEAGHLVFGLATGYKFCSFRVFSFMWIKIDDKIKLKRYSLAGTEGQCLMSPPDLVDGKMPVVLYNFGGCIFNFITASIALILYFIIKENIYVKTALMIFAILGFCYSLINGIPFKLGEVNNDGYNAISLGKNPKATKALWTQLKISEYQTQGLRLKNMPEKMFVMPTVEEMNNSLISAIAVFRCNRLMDEQNFEEAKNLITTLLNREYNILGVYRNMLTCDLIYLNLISKNDSDEIEKLYSKSQKNFMKAMKTNLSVIRTNYAYALLFEKDANKAQEIKIQFEKQEKTYPYKADFQSEYELLTIAEKLSVNN